MHVCVFVCATKEAAVQAAACARSGTLRQNGDPVCACVYVCRHSGAYVCAHVSFFLVCLCVYRGGGAILATHLRWAILLLCLQTCAHKRAYTWLRIGRALCQASCSLAGAGSAPERVVASICSTGEQLDCVSEPV